ncbi:MAG: lamin tail domain-containing protein [candidate division KSB1 bacterium]|nr:lamin tail domain-containing protein [candidate division KSB1 bacterium]
MKFKSVWLLLFSAVPCIGAVRINEFMAANRTVLEDPQEKGEYPDWIELYNSGSDPIDLSGWTISDDPFDETQRLPSGISIPGKGYLLLIADGEPHQGPRHLGFKLKAEGGSIYLNAAGACVDSLRYPPQQSDLSYGRAPDGADQLLFLSFPTPGRANPTTGFLGRVGNVLFSRPHGFYDEPFELMLSVDPPQAEIFYTLDGSEPSDREEGSTRRYRGPLHISTTTAVRARAFLPQWQPSGSVTQTYIFPQQVIRQPKNPPGFPRNWGLSGLGDYEMDPHVVNHPKYRDEIISDLLSLPAISLVMPVDDWFGDNGRGIYVQGENDERACSVEWIPTDGSEGFQINCGVMVVGGTSPDRWKIDKLSLRLKFKREYGEAKLHYPLFGFSATDEFDTIVLDARCNNTWAYGGSVRVQGRDLRQNDIAQYTRDPFTAELQRLAGGLAPHGRQVHLYLNGLYWGLYYLHERPDEHFAAAYRGGRAEDYDVVKHNPDQVVAGSNEAYKQMFAVANSSRPLEEKYVLLEEMLDLDDFISYLLVNFYLGNYDWAHQNWYATRAKSGRESKWRYHSWDAEHVMEAVDWDVTGKNDDGGPTRLHQVLKDHPVYRRRFADRVYSLFFNDGILSTERIKALYARFAEEVYRPIVCESARWGDSRRDTPYTRDVEWIRERNWLLNQYFPQRREIVLDQLRRRGLYPRVEPPRFLIAGQETNGGRISPGTALTLQAASPIYYTLDGTDPQAEGETRRTTWVPVGAAKKVLVPSTSYGIRWRSDLSYDDSQWLSVVGGVGYDLDGTYRPFINFDTRSLMYDPRNGKPTSCYLRIPFKLEEEQLAGVRRLYLKMRYDDGFVAFINGGIAASANAPAVHSWDAAALSAREASEEELFDCSSVIKRLKAGDNLLAIQAMNVSSSSSDFLITVELIAEEGKNSTPSPKAIRYEKPIVVERTTLIAARTTDGYEWSPLHRVLLAVADPLPSLRITEIHYNPLSEADRDGSSYEFIELKNIGVKALDLGFSRFCRGIGYTFPANARLEPNAFYVIASDSEAFYSRYHFPPNGVFSGNLDNAGERLVLINAAGDTIIDLRYNDRPPWPKEADGSGKSLVAGEVEPRGDPNRAEYWRASALMHGSPRRDDRAALEVVSAQAQPARYELWPPYPNPFNTSTVLRFALPVEGQVRVRLFNLLGQEVAVPVDDRMSAGVHDITLDAASLSSGVYVVKFEAGTFNRLRKITVLK